MSGREWREAADRAAAIRAARPHVRSCATIPGVNPVPAGTPGRESWRGEGCGEWAGTVWVQVIFDGYGARDCRPDQIVTEAAP
jgi:hypothetical protein